VDARALQQPPHRIFPRPLHNKVRSPLHQPLLRPLELPLIRSDVAGLDCLRKRAVERFVPCGLGEQFRRGEDAAEEEEGDQVVEDEPVRLEVSVRASPYLS
jgi:hypothetical protein